MRDTVLQHILEACLREAWECNQVAERNEECTSSA